MATESEAVKSAAMVPLELKHEPRSKGLTTPRKKKPKELAVITECCTGCAGSHACIGCKKCVSKGPDGCFLDGCPWDAIVMVDIVEVEKVVGAMTF